MRSKIEHFFNEKAAEILQNRRRSFNVAVPEGLSNWISGADFYNGYFLGPREPRDSVDRQIANAAEKLDDFSIEMFLNKVHLEDDADDDFPPTDYVLIYFAVCDHFARYVMERDITKPMVLWYSTDAFEIDTEFPSYTMSFGFPRSEKDYYNLEVDAFQYAAVIGTLITFVQ